MDMALTRWFTHNFADTDGPTHPDLIPLPLYLPPDVVTALLVEVIGGLPRWAVMAVNGHTVRAARRTRLWGFIDDIALRMEETVGGCVVHARSQSRLGKADLGQNRRNLRELFAAVRGAIRTE